MKKTRQPFDWGVAAVLAGLLALYAGAMALHGHAAYGDWTCGFKRCVQVSR